ncbi:hypothetical protein PVAND_007837 [Polypedilum vanderplanki]|uniref:Uncharacterized protein n=1 Tax=Polypedilum vanderplanki TaxID=319348 RepID=A0A9J6C8M4_POLVA|nr:hypothetical protein PVAND_007837 [Polypedilum vanderplanki]
MIFYPHFMIIFSSFIITVLTFGDFGGQQHLVNGAGLPYNFPFIPNVLPTAAAPPTFAPITTPPVIDPRINRLVQLMVNTRDLQFSSLDSQTQNGKKK